MSIKGRQATFKDATYSLLICGRAFGKAHCVCFVYLRLTDIVEDLISSNHLASSSSAICMRYTTVAKMMDKHRGVFTLAAKPGKDVLAAKTLGTTHLHGPTFYISSEK